MRGSGAFRLAEYQPSVKFEYRKNPDWYDASKVLIDGIRQTIITEYATGLAQFRAGNLWTFPVRADEILQTKRDLPRLMMMMQDYFERACAKGGQTPHILREALEWHIQLEETGSML